MRPFMASLAIMICGTSGYLHSQQPQRKVTVIEETLPQPAAPKRKVTVVEEDVPVPTIRQRVVIREEDVPVQVYTRFAVPVVPTYSYVPVYAPLIHPKAVVDSYRTGLFGLQHNYVHADGTVARYGPLGFRR